MVWDIVQFAGFDLETCSQIEGHPEYALQPWRLPGKAQITHAALAYGKHISEVRSLRPVASAIQEALEGCGRTPIATWNGVFDLAWLAQLGVPIEAFVWWDAMLLWKWLEPNRESYSLAAAAEEILGRRLRLRWVDDYVKLKASEQEAGFATAHTEEYNRLDALATAWVASYCWEALDERRRRAASVERALLVPVAYSWARGVPLDLDYVRSLRSRLDARLRVIERDLRLDAEVLASPDKLARVLYAEWGLPIVETTPTGAPSTAKESLVALSAHDERVRRILEWRAVSKRLGTFVDGAIECADYNGVPRSHSCPRIYSTYTGRMTYESRQQRRYPIGIPQHQVPREAEFRRIVIAPPHQILIEADFSGQEMRLLADIGQEETLRRIFREGGDPHSYTGARLAGIGYAEFLERLKARDPEIAGPRGARHLGKFVNLSLQYRTSPGTLRTRAAVDYGLHVSYAEAERWHATYHALYPGVKQYWRRAIQLARSRGYAETVSGRRCELSPEHFAEDAWAAESSAINFPIQGSGADQKELALAVVSAKFPELRFAFDLHDGIYWWAPEMPPHTLQSLLADLRQTLERLPYYIWDWEPAVPYPVEIKSGETWGTMEAAK